MVSTMLNSFSAANFTGRFLQRRQAKGMHWKASRATAMAMTHTYDGWAAQPMAPDMGPMNVRTITTNSSDVNPTAVRVVEYTFFGSSPSLLAKRKKVVSMPQVRMTSSSAVQAYTLVMTPQPPLAADSLAVQSGTSRQLRKRPTMLLSPQIAVSFAREDNPAIVLNVKR